MLHTKLEKLTRIPKSDKNSTIPPLFLGFFLSSRPSRVGVSQASPSVDGHRAWPPKWGGGHCLRGEGCIGARTCASSCIHRKRRRQPSFSAVAASCVRATQRPAASRRDVTRFSTVSVRVKSSVRIVMVVDVLFGVVFWGTRFEFWEAECWKRCRRGRVFFGFLVMLGTCDAT